MKYRGSRHGTNEYPFLIDADGIELLPVTSAGLDHPAPAERLSSGIPGLDEMLGGQGLFLGTTFLISGTAGTGKTSFAAAMAEASCRRDERCLFFAFEESPAQIVRNARSVGIELEPSIGRNLLRIEAARPSFLGVEAHLTRIYRLVRDFAPRFVVLDPVSNLASAGTDAAAYGMLLRLIDFFKSRETTILMTILSSPDESPEKTNIGISSLVDTWVLLQNLERNGDRTRGISFLKARGSVNSSQVREFRLTDDGIKIQEEPR